MSDKFGAAEEPAAKRLGSTMHGPIVQIGVIGNEQQIDACFKGSDGAIANAKSIDGAHV
ncbi:MAG: hypothetical protein V5B40_04695 [Candidatus Accumulibacter meliphilus]